MMQEIYQKQFSIGKILSESWKIFKENFRLILIITLIFSIPKNIIYLYIPIKQSIDIKNSYLSIFQALDSFIAIIPMMAIAYAIKNKIDGKSVSIGEALKKSLSRWGAAIITNLNQSLLLLGLTLLLIIPRIIFYVYWIFTIYAVILNDKSGINALDYSKNIVKGRWWTVLGYSSVFSIMKLFFYTIQFIILVIGWLLSKNFLINIGLFIFLILTDIIFSFFTVVNTIFYINFDSTKKTYTTGFVPSSSPPSNYTKLPSP